MTAGVHRYYTHRSFKAKVPLQIILLACYSVAGQVFRICVVFNFSYNYIKYCIFILQYRVTDWVHDHRLHHKFSDTDGDPHNANRGLFFSHIGWLMQRGHPEVFRRSKTIDMSDINKDPLVQFHTKYILLFKLYCKVYWI